jgi:MFS family permease
MVIGGGAWLAFISLSNALVQTLAPDWVRARVLAIFLLITQGGLAAGSVVWGTIGSRVSVAAALIVSGIATIATTALGLVARLPDTVADISPWNHWPLPALGKNAAPAPDDGPVLVTVEYRVATPHVDRFVKAMEELGRVRRRDGASRWGIFRDVEQPDRYVESFLVTSWAEHLRQHERLTRADSAIEQEVRAHLEESPVIRHLIYAESRD